jgi:dihydroorotase
MAHIGPAPPTAVEVTEMLRPGDILTHCWSPRASWQQDGGSDPTPPTAAQLRHLSLRGVLLDIGHGASSFSFAIAEQMASSGVWPDTISTDVHVNSVDGPVHDLPTTMTKLMELGMPLMDVVRAATQTPARVARLARGRGSLTVGGVADLAVFSLEDERFDMVDSGNEVRTAQRRLRAITTFASGVEWT